MRRRSFLTSGAGVLSVGLLAGCRRGGASDAIEVLISSDPLSLDPRFSVDVHGMRLGRLLYATLTRPHPATLTPMPGLLTAALEIEAGDAVLVTLGPHRFHDGTKVTARDVLSTFRALADAALGSPSRRVLTHLLPPEALDGADGARVRFRSRTPRATLAGDLDFPILKADEAARPRDAPLTGSGPMRVAARAPGLVSLVPTAGAHGHPLAVRTVRDETARAMRVLGGRADVVANGLGPALALSLPSRADAPPGLGATVHPSASTTVLLLQNERPPLDRPEIRVAIAHSIDRAAIVAARLAGAAQLAAGLLPPALHVPAPAQRPTDPAAARAALAGLSPLVLVTGTDRARLGIARAIAQALRDAGVPVEVRSFELATLLARLNAGDFHLAPMIASELTDGDNLRWYLHSEAIPPAAANRARVRDPDIDRWLEEGLAERDAEARRAIYARIEARIHARCYVIPLFHEAHVVITSARARNFRPSVDGRWAALAEI